MKYLLIFIIVTSICSCNSKTALNEERIQFEKSMITDSTVIVDVMSNTHEGYPLSRLIDSVRYVSLEFSDEALVGIMRKVKVINGLIYVWDLDSGLVKCFDNKGKFIRTVYQKGGGPEEVAHPIDFDVDENYVYVLDGAKIAIQVFNHKGEYVEKREMSFRAQEFKALPDKQFLWQLAPYGIGNEDNYDLVALSDSTLNIRQRYLKFIDGLWMAVTFENQQDFKYLFQMYGRSVYEKRDSTIFMKYYLDFGSKYFNAEKDVDGFKDAIERGIYFATRAPLHNDQYLLHSYDAGLRRSGTLLLRLKDNKSMFIKDPEQDRDDVYYFLFGQTLGYDCKSNEFYRLSNYIDLASITSDNKDEVVKKWREEIPKEVQPYIIPEDAEKQVNQILMFYKLRDDIEFD